MSIDLQKLNRMLAVKAEEQVDEELFEQTAADKIQSILAQAQADCDAETYAAISDAINAFADSSEIQKLKLYHYCMDFVDPTRPVKLAASSNVTVVNHRFFNDSELSRLNDFVNAHARDKGFGDVVYEIMGRRGLTPPQLYRRAMLSRQDFNRITDPRCKNVTRPMVWNVILGLQCTPMEAEYVLFSAGYRKRNDKFDLTLMFFLEHKNYDIMAVNAVLADFGLKPLSCFVPVSD